MKDTSELTACVIDGGLFVELALRLARKYKRVLYQCTIDQPFPKINEAVIGDGMEIERIQDFWPIKSEVDLFVFPDCANAGLQNELVAQGYPVWGSRDGVDLELKRLWFKKQLKSLGLEVGTYKVCRGLTELRQYLWDKEDKWVKISKFRGTRETWHWANRQTSEGELDNLGVLIGDMKESMVFIVEDCIETEVEWGYDGYFCGGRFPTVSCHGPEVKDKSYIGSIVQWSDLPEQVREILEMIAPLLSQLNYTNAFSAEIRIAKDGKAYFTDPTCRYPWPAGAPQMELYKNLPEIIWHGANGHCLDPEYDETVAAEVMINHDADEEKVRTLVVPDDVRQWTKLMWMCKTGPERYSFPPFPHSCDAVGSLIGIGDTIEEAVDAVKEHVESFSDQPVTINTDVLAAGIKILQSAEESDIDLTEKPLPNPEVAITD